MQGITIWQGDAWAFQLNFWIAEHRSAAGSQPKRPETGGDD
jgi:hypothetical protein